MSRSPRQLVNGFCYHITTRCNNREFNLSRRDCREVLLYAIKKAQVKYGFKLYALCIMLNHVHYLIEPQKPEDLPKIMHWLNWYTAMCFNRILNRRGHFWEQRYYSAGFAMEDKQRALNTLRYIHGNPAAAGMKQGFFYDFSNYGTYDQLTEDGLTQWHPAFLELGNSLDDCAKRYKGFCKRYKPPKKKQEKCSWGSRLLTGLGISNSSAPRVRSKHKASPQQLCLPFSVECQVSKTENEEVEKFILANRCGYRVGDAGF